MAACSDWPALGETATEPMLSMVALIVVGKLLCIGHMLADILTLGPCHDMLVPLDQPVVPVTLLVPVDIIAAARGGSGCGGFGCGRSSGWGC